MPARATPLSSHARDGRGRRLVGAWLAAVLLVTGIAVTGVVVAPATAEAATIDDAVDRVPPRMIRVCRRSGAVDTVAFKDYVKTVLPREFPSSWHPEVLRAAAVAIRSYAWYWLEHPDSRLGGRCDIGDTTRYQVYKPEDRVNPPTPLTDAIVDEMWPWRLEAADGDALFAQYCNCRTFRAGRHIQQVDARADADRGMTWRQIIAKYYRNMDHRLVDWRAPFAVEVAGQVALRDDAVTVAVRGPAPDDPRVTGTLYGICTRDGDDATFVVDTARLVGGTLSFDPAPLRDCAEDDVEVHAYATARGETLAGVALTAVRAWRADEPHDVLRVGASTDPTTASIAISRRLFAAPVQRAGALEVAHDTASAGVRRDDSGSVARHEGGTPTTAGAPDAVATVAVIARGDVFADGLAATGLAGDRGPILLHPGGPDAPLDERVLAEVDRVLGSRGVVHLVGGPSAVSPAVEQGLVDAGHDVRRHAGPDRIATALAVADAVVGEFGVPPAVVVARAFPDDSRGWADATTGGAWAAARNRPVLLTRTEAMDDRVAAWLAAADGLREVVLLGGEAALAPAVADAVTVTATRVAGTDRADTAVAIAEELWSRDGGPGVEGALLVNLRAEHGWAWAIATAPYAARHGTPALAARRLIARDTTGAFLDANPGLPVVVVGPEQLLPPDVEEALAGQ